VTEVVGPLRERPSDDFRCEHLLPGRRPHSAVEGAADPAAVAHRGMSALTVNSHQVRIGDAPSVLFHQEGSEQDRGQDECHGSGDWSPRAEYAVSRINEPGDAQREEPSRNHVRFPMNRLPLSYAHVNGSRIGITLGETSGARPGLAQLIRDVSHGHYRTVAAALEAKAE
jgi:hypothetical protein